MSPPCPALFSFSFSIKVDSDAQFAAVLTAKLYNLDSVRGSPEPLEEYENPSSMETQVRWLSRLGNTILENVVVDQDCMVKVTM
jgi:hypothetical protein